MIWVSWINSTWRRWHLQRCSKHCTAAMTENTRRRQSLCLSLDSMGFFFSSHWFPDKNLCATILPCYPYSGTTLSPSPYVFSLLFHLFFYFPCVHPLPLCQSFIHPQCVKGYRVHSSGALLKAALTRADVLSLFSFFCPLSVTLLPYLTVFLNLHSNSNSKWKCVFILLSQIPIFVPLWVKCFLSKGNC